MSVELFRLHTAVSTGVASWGEVELFESREAFEVAYLDALLDVEAEGARGFRLSLIRRWQRLNGRKFDDTKRVTRVVAAQQLVDGDWHDRSARVLPPRLEYRVT